MRNPIIPLEKRLFRRTVESSNGCWLWTGSTDRNGYGRIASGGRKSSPIIQAHRAAWELLRGEIPSGLEVDHLCRVRNCINPWHMDLVTHQVNVRRSDGPAGINYRKALQS